jgi:transposase-like protein
MRKKYTTKKKAQIVLEILKEERSIPRIASEYGIHPNQLYKWKAQALEGLPNLFEDERKTEKVLRAAHEQELNELYAEIGRLTTQLNWLKKKSGIEPIER